MQDVRVASERSAHPILPAVAYVPSNGFTSEEVAHIAQLLAQGESQYAIAQSLDVRQNRISRLAAHLGIETASVRRLSMQKAREARAELTAERQRLATDLLGERIWSELERKDLDPQAAKALRDLAVSLGVAIDKRRLIDGESTANQSVQVRVWGRRELPNKQPDQ